jgi:hypothetical protein
MALFSRSSKPAAGTGATSVKTKASKASKAPKAAKPKRPRGARLKTVKAAFIATRKQDPKVLPLVLIAFFGPFLLLLAIGLLVGWGWYLGFLGFSSVCSPRPSCSAGACRRPRTRRSRGSSARPPRS